MAPSTGGISIKENEVPFRCNFYNPGLHGIALKTIDPSHSRTLLDLFSNAMPIRPEKEVRGSCRSSPPPRLGMAYSGSSSSVAFFFYIVNHVYVVARSQFWHVNPSRTTTAVESVKPKSTHVGLGTPWLAPYDANGGDHS